MMYNLSKLLYRRFSDIPLKEALKDINNKLCKVRGKPKEIRKSIRVAIIGKANAGKSTLINAIMGMNICAASIKPQTTMEHQRVFHIRDDTEIVLLDTPGIISYWKKKKYGIKNKADVFTIGSVKKVGLVGVVVDASDKYSKSVLPSDVKNFIATYPDEMEMILILNKVDKVKCKFNLLTYVDKLCNDLKSSEDKNLSSRSFSRIFMISALKNDGVNDLVEYIRSVAHEKTNYTSSERLSDHSDSKIVEDTVRAALLENFDRNIPYECSCQVEYMQEDVSGTVNIVVLISCPTASIQRTVGQDYRLKMISFVCEENLKIVFGKPIYLRLQVVLDECKRNKKKRKKEEIKT